MVVIDEESCELGLAIRPQIKKSINGPLTLVNTDFYISTTDM